MSFSKTRESGFLRFWHLKTCAPTLQELPKAAIFAFKKRSKDRSLRQLLHFCECAVPELAAARKAHLRNNIVYHCCKFLQCDSEEPCE
nr:hypothetical protein [uncultured Pseudomonas sp.]